MSTLDEGPGDADGKGKAALAPLDPPPPPPPPDGNVNDSRSAAKPGPDVSIDPDTTASSGATGAASSLTRPVTPLTIEDEIRQEVYARRVAGGIIGCAGTFVVALVIILATWRLNALIPKPVPEGKEYILIIAMAAHVGISVAAVWFGYQMLRAAERMFVPRRFLADAKDVEVLKALIGISAPTTALLDQMKGFTGDVPSVIRAAVEAGNSIRPKEKPPKRQGSRNGAA